MVPWLIQKASPMLNPWWPRHHVDHIIDNLHLGHQLLRWRRKIAMALSNHPINMCHRWWGFFGMRPLINWIQLNYVHIQFQSNFNIIVPKYAKYMPNLSSVEPLDWHKVLDRPKSIEKVLDFRIIKEFQCLGATFLLRGWSLPQRCANARCERHI